MTSENTNPNLTGWGKLLITLYAILALAATGRSLYSLSTKFSEAPLPYTLSAVSAIVYVIATYALYRHKFTLARYAVLFELIGVLVIGTLSFFHIPALEIPGASAGSTVWSYYGMGYGWVPLILPVLGLIYLDRTSKVTAAPRPNK